MNDFTVRIHKGSHITECYGDLEHEAASKSKTIAGGVQHTNFFYFTSFCMHSQGVHYQDDDTNWYGNGRGIVGDQQPI